MGRLYCINLRFMNFVDFFMVKRKFVPWIRFKRIFCLFYPRFFGELRGETPSGWMGFPDISDIDLRSNPQRYRMEPPHPNLR